MWGRKSKESHRKLKDSGRGEPRDFAENELKLSLSRGEEHVRNLGDGGREGHRANSQKMSLN